MARAKKYTPPKAAAWSAPKARKKPTKPKAPKVLRALEQVFADMDGVAVRVEAEMDRERTDPTEFMRPWSGPLGDLRTESNTLLHELGEIAKAAGKDGQNAVWDAVRARWRDEAGSAPTWARGGSWLVWIGRIPVVCHWAGWFTPHAEMLACDKDLPWIAENGRLAVTGRVPAEARTVEGLFRVGLMSLIERPNFRLLKLGSMPKMTKTEERRYCAPAGLSVARELADSVKADEGDWLKKALARGPVNYIRLPDTLKPIQLSII